MTLSSEWTLDWLEQCHRNSPARTLRVFLDLRCLSEYDVLPDCVALLPEQLARAYLQSLGSDLYVGDLRLAQIAEPIRVAWSARGRAPDEETIGGVEVAHAG